MAYRPTDAETFASEEVGEGELTIGELFHKDFRFMQKTSPKNVKFTAELVLG